MKTQPKPQAIPMSHEPWYADNQTAFPALQAYAPGQSAANRPHDHILRAALLTNGCTIQNEAVETH